MKKQSGFTLIELMIVVAIVAILAAVAMPAYKGYVAKAKFSDVINSVSAVKSQVELCYSENNSLAGCLNSSSGSNFNILASGSYSTANLTGVAITDATSSAITITGTASGASGISGKTYSLVGAGNAAGIQWTVSGTCKADGLCG